MPRKNDAPAELIRIRNLENGFETMIDRAEFEKLSPDYRATWEVLTDEPKVVLPEPAPSEDGAPEAEEPEAN